jgi:hypothetical protein
LWTLLTISINSTYNYKEQKQFERLFQEFTRKEPVVTFMTYPFGIFDVEDVATKINTLLSLDSTVVKNLVLVLQIDMQLKAHSSDIHF